MTSTNRPWKLGIFCALAALMLAGVVWTQRFWPAAQAFGAQIGLEPSFAQTIKPFLTQKCLMCHNADNQTAGVRVDQLDGALEDRHLRLWEAIRHRVSDGSMPPKGMPQPTAGERQQVTDWITRALDVARLRPAPKNGMVRRLTVAQYRNTLQELLQLEDALTEALPPDAVSKDGFLNNKETLQLSPLLMEAYLEIAGEALTRAMVDPAKKPAVQNFRMDLGRSKNPAPFPEPLVLGANSLLLDNKDFVVTQLTADKPFPFEPFFMKTKYRFIEGYQGNDTVRGWRDYDSIYHSVFACMRGSTGYPKGNAYGTVPEGLLLRPAIPNDELFQKDGTYGPKANFKISLRELPDHGRFRVTVTAAKYRDGLLLESGAAPRPEGGLEVNGAPDRQTVTIAKPGIYQVDVHSGVRAGAMAAPDGARLREGLGGEWTFDGDSGGVRAEGDARFVDSPFGKAVTLDGNGDALTVARNDGMNVGDGDFTVSAWIHPRQLRRAGIVSLGGSGWTHGWYLELAERGVLRLATAGANEQSSGTVSSPAQTIRVNAWQHVAAVVRRGKGETWLYVNGYPVAKGDVARTSLDNPKMDLQIGRIGSAEYFRGELDEVRIHRRALEMGELQALVEPGRKFAKAPPDKPEDLTLTLGGREFTGALTQPAFLVLRLDAGPLAVQAQLSGVKDVVRLVLTPLAPEDALARKFAVFEKRVPRLGVHVGLRRDCGSTFAPAGPAQVVGSEKASRYVFEGAIRNFPSPDVEKDNVNYLAGVREIAVRSEYTDGRDMPRLLIQSVEFEGPFYESWPPATHKNLFVDSPKKSDPRAYGREIVNTFAARAYRRPVTADEEAALTGVFEKSFAAGGDLRESVKAALQVVLTSPQFLFLVERSSTPAAEPLEGYELASKLSYFLWNGPPDRTTLRLAETGALRGQLNAEVGRMLGDPRFGRSLQEFASQWLSLDKFQVVEVDRKQFPLLSRDAKGHLVQEPVEYLRYMILNNLPVKNLIASDFVVANEAVAAYYDLGEKTESGLQYVPVRHGRKELGGLLTQAAILSGLSDGRESNPVKRGAWLARKIVSEPPSDPPPNVPALKDDPALKLTLRQRIERHRTQPGCVQCHLKIDPWGVALEEFDAGGRLKKEPADARSTLPDKAEVAGIYDLKRHLAEDRLDQVAFSFLKHLAIYANGRSLTYGELDFLKKDALRLKESGYRMQDMFRYVVTSKFFLEK
jgi:hypothetical protein